MLVLPCMSFIRTPDHDINVATSPFVSSMQFETCFTANQHPGPKNLIWGLVDNSACSFEGGEGLMRVPDRLADSFSSVSNMREIMFSHWLKCCSLLLYSRVEGVSNFRQ